MYFLKTTTKARGLDVLTRMLSLVSVQRVMPVNEIVTIVFDWVELNRI